MSGQGLSVSVRKTPLPVCIGVMRALANQRINLGASSRAATVVTIEPVPLRQVWPFQNSVIKFYPCREGYLAVQF